MDGRFVGYLGESRRSETVLDLFQVLSTTVADESTVLEGVDSCRVVEVRTNSNPSPLFWSAVVVGHVKGSSDMNQLLLN